MKIRKIDINLLNSSKYNPRKDLQSEDIEYKKIKRSIEEFGFVDPLIVNKDMTVIGGNQRLKVLKELGYKEVDCVLLDLDKTREKALNIALNKIEGEFDLPKLKDLLLELDTGEIDMDITGFDYTELEELMTQFYVPDESEKDDEVPEIPEEPISKLGDLYKLGEHRLLCGDATKIKDVKRLMNGNKADMIFTDPPYGVSFQSNMRTKSKKFDVLKSDNKIITDWIALAAMFSTGWVLFCTTWKVLCQWLDVGKQIGELSNMIIWDKGGGGIGDLKHSLSTDYEIILAYGRGNEIIGKRIGSVWEIGKDNPNVYAHPTQKPVELSVLAIRTFSKGDILDLFGGSGTTLIACEKLKRKCYMMEIDPHYVDVIIKRYENYTNKKARLIKNGNTRA